MNKRTHWRWIKRALARYFLEELDRTAGEGYHPAARGALLDLAREWLLHTENRAPLPPLEILEGLRRQVDAGPRLCPQCREVFYPPPFEAAKKKYCSHKCCRRAQNDMLAQRRRTTRKVKQCPGCGRSLEHRTGHAKWCGDSCRNRVYYQKYKERRNSQNAAV